MTCALKMPADLIDEKKLREFNKTLYAYAKIDAQEIDGTVGELIMVDWILHQYCLTNAMYHAIEKIADTFAEPNFVLGASEARAFLDGYHARGEDEGIDPADTEEQTEALNKYADGLCTRETIVNALGDDKAPELAPKEASYEAISNDTPPMAHFSFYQTELEILREALSLLSNSRCQGGTTDSPALAGLRERLDVTYKELVKR